MIIEGTKLKRGDQLFYRGYVAQYEGDEFEVNADGVFVLFSEQDYDSAISFPWSLEQIIKDVDEEIGFPPNYDEDSVELVIQ